MKKIMGEPCKCGRATAYIIVTVMLLLMLSVGVVMIISDTDAKISIRYVPSSITLINAEVINNDVVRGFKCRNKFISLWESSNGDSVMISPLASKEEKSVAQRQLSDYPLNITLNCVCDPGNNLRYPNVERGIACSFYTKCFLSVKDVNHLKSKIRSYKIGLGLLITCIILLIVVMTSVYITDIGYLKCCSRREYANINS